jgi:hypothetical protein
VNIKTANDLRSVLMKTIEGVIEGRVPVAHAGAIANLSEQVHKSIEQEWDMRVYANEHFRLDAPQVIALIGDYSND